MRPAMKRGDSAKRLVWHSNQGASGHRPSKQSNFKPLKYRADGKRKNVVHFSTIEVQPFHFDWSTADDVFYTRKELTAMGQDRFDDAAKLRQQRRREEKGEGGHTTDDVDISKRSKEKDTAALLALALDHEDRDDNVSIRGIEHFVFPDLQQEMIRRKKAVQREVMDFVKDKRPDPQGWRLAQHSRNYSQWARNVAMEKGMKYCLNNAAGDPDISLSDGELERLQRSKDEVDGSNLSLRGSSSFSQGIPAGGSHSFDKEHSKNADPPNLCPDFNQMCSIDEDDKPAGDTVSQESQPAGASTVED